MYGSNDFMALERLLQSVAYCSTGHIYLCWHPSTIYAFMATAILTKDSH